MIKLIDLNSHPKIAELIDDKYIISQVQDILDIMGDLFPLDCKKFIVHEANLHSDFFDLRTGLAGDILQKFSNYRVQLAVVGDFSKYESKSLKDFIYESNKANLIFFVPDMKSAIQALL